MPAYKKVEHLEKESDVLAKLKIENVGIFELEWKTIELNGFPSNSLKYGFNTPFVDCIVSACNHENPKGAVIEKCRWDTKLKKWHVSDIVRNWMLHPPYEITHYIDNMPTPFDNQ